MNYGNIHGNAKAGELYRFLRAHVGEWFTNWELTLELRTTCIGTRISEVRNQLSPEWAIEVRHSSQAGWSYRLIRVRVEEPMLI